MTSPLQNLLDEISNCAERASPCSLESVDFNGELHLDGPTGYFGWEMDKCYRDYFTAASPKNVAKLVQMLRKAVEALEAGRDWHRNGTGQTWDDFDKLFVEALTEINAIAEGLGKT